MRVLVFGDSIAQGFWDTEGGWVARLRNNSIRYALKDIRNREYQDYYNLSIDGDSSKDLLKRIKLDIENRIWSETSQIAVVFAIGTNDSPEEDGNERTTYDEFKSNIEELIHISRKYTDRIIFVGNTTVDETKTDPVFWANVSYTNKAMKKYEEIIKSVCEKENIAFVPIFDMFKKYIEDGTEILQDGIHPNNDGHKLIAEQVGPELDKLIA